MTDYKFEAGLCHLYEHGQRSFDRSFLHECSYENKTLNDIDFTHSYLGGSSFRGAKLQNARFVYCDLSDCNFEGADLRGADLSNAEIFHTNFDGANLTHANFQNSHGVRLASFKDTVGAMTFQEVGSRCDTLLVVKRGKILWFKTGCFWGNEMEFRRAIRDRHIHSYFGNKVFARQYWACIKEAHAKLDA
jgi:hypothetical protein